LIAGHVSNNGTNGALYKLKNVGTGSMAYLGCGNGQVSTWQATSSYVKNQNALTWDLFNPNGTNRLVVVTCEADANGNYTQNRIVIFSRVS